MSFNFNVKEQVEQFLERRFQQALGSASDKMTYILSIRQQLKTQLLALFSERKDSLLLLFTTQLRESMLRDIVAKEDALWFGRTQYPFELADQKIIELKDKWAKADAESKEAFRWWCHAERAQSEALFEHESAQLAQALRSSLDKISRTNFKSTDDTRSRTDFKSTDLTSHLNWRRQEEDRIQVLKTKYHELDAEKERLAEELSKCVVERNELTLSYDRWFKRLEAKKRDGKDIAPQLTSIEEGLLRSKIDNYKEGLELFFSKHISDKIEEILSNGYVSTINAHRAELKEGQYVNFEVEEQRALLTKSLQTINKKLQIIAGDKARRDELNDEIKRRQKERDETYERGNVIRRLKFFSGAFLVIIPLFLLCIAPIILPVTIAIAAAIELLIAAIYIGTGHLVKQSDDKRKQQSVELGELKNEEDSLYYELLNSGELGLEKEKRRIEETLERLEHNTTTTQNPTPSYSITGCSIFKADAPKTDVPKELPNLDTPNKNCRANTSTFLCDS